MRSLFITLVLLVFVSSLGLEAQTQRNFEVITVENANDLVEVRTWNRDETAIGFQSVAFSPDGSELAIALYNGRIEFVSMETLETIRVIDGIETDAERLTYSPDGSELLLWSNTGVYNLVDVESGEILAVNTTTIENTLFSPTPDMKKYILSTFFENGISVHDLITGQELLSVEDATCGHVSYDGMFLLTCKDDSLVQIWNIESGEMIFQIMPPTQDIVLQGTGFTPDGLVWASYPQFTDSNNREVWDSPIQFWDITSGELVTQLEGEGVGYYTSLYIDPTNTYALVWGLSRSFSQSCWLWNIEENEPIPCLAGGNQSVTFSPDGQLLAINNGTDYNVYIRETAKPSRPVAVLETNPTYYVEFSSNGRFLVTVDWEIHLWSVSSQGD